MDILKIGLLGLGTVGGGTVNVLQQNATRIAHRAGCEILVKSAVVRDLESERICDTANIALGTDAGSLLNDTEIGIVVETIGGIDLAYDLVTQALNNGKHVVTANKALIATRGNELLALAQQKGLTIAFEAAVAGGIPVIKALREGLAGNEIESIAGILNGTSNFILSKMDREKLSFDEVLKEAQARGYAEADPTLDINGTDAAHKLAILAALAYDQPFDFDALHIEGIENISLEDINNADKLGYRIKHLGIVNRRENGLETRVHPTLVPKHELVANVDGAMNAVMIQGNAVGPTLYYGQGAGAAPTASAIVADIIDIARHNISLGWPQDSAPSTSRISSNISLKNNASPKLNAMPIEQTRSDYYLRLEAQDKPGVLAEIANLLASFGISIEAMVQAEPPLGAPTAKLVFLTHEVEERAINRAIDAIADLESVISPIVKLRMQHFEDKKV